MDNQMNQPVTPQDQNDKRISMQTKQIEVYPLSLTNELKSMRKIR